MIKYKVAIYVRVSTQEQAKEGYSVGEQTDRLRKFAEAHGWIIAKVYVDAGHSGSNTDRPALQEMIEDVKAGKLDKVLVYKLDRLSRSQKDTLELIEDVFLPNNCDFESMTEKLDTGTPQGRLFLGILAAFAQLEREMIKERMSMGRYARIKEGKFQGGCRVPFGYDYEPALDKLVINEYEAMIVKLMFDEFTSGKPLYSIENLLLDKGYTFNCGKVDRRNMRYILRNKTYCGYQKCKDEWLPALHDPIITEDEYEAAQKILTANREKFNHSGYRDGIKVHSTNLGGLIYCGKCGARFAKSRTGSKDYGFHYNYCCYSRHKKVKAMIKDPNCKNKFYRIETLDNIIFNEIKKLSVDPDYIKQLKKEHEKLDDVQKIRALEHKIKSINTQISRFMDLYGLGNYSIEELNEKTMPLQDQRSKLQAEIAKLQKDTGKMTEPEVMHLVASFEDALLTGTLEDRRSIIEQLIDKIVINDDDITIHWNFI